MATRLHRPPLLSVAIPDVLAEVVINSYVTEAYRRCLGRGRRRPGGRGGGGKWVSDARDAANGWSVDGRGFAVVLANMELFPSFSIIENRKW